jgi:UDP-N-acetylglucosamine acyltransferase
VIHESAIIDPTAVIGKNVTVGPWTMIGADVVVGDDCNIGPHVVLKGPTILGSNNKIYQFSTIGDDTPDLKYKGEPTRLIVGDNNVIREGVTIHRGTVQDNSETVIGSNNLLMAYVHIGHDCVVGDHVIMINNSAIAGHVHVGDWSILSGNPAEPRTINREGLKRRGFSADDIALINKAYKILYRRGLKLSEAISTIKNLGDQTVISVFVESLEKSNRGIIR